MQEQRLKRLNKNIDLQNIDAERKLRHEEWIESQKRKLLMAGLNQAP